MAHEGASSSSRLERMLEEQFDLIDGSESGWVEARTSCDHLGWLAADLTHIQTPETPCNSFGEMVGCFRYASIDLHSAYLPPPKLEFNYDNQDWRQKEDEVHNRANMLFAEVGKALKQMSYQFAGVVLQEGGNKASDFRNLISELEGMMQKEKEEFGVGWRTKCISY